MRVRIGIAFVVATFAAAPAAAKPYWVSWTGDNYPEEDGWTRTITDANGVPGQGGAIRSLDAGVLTLDSRRSARIVDYYTLHRLVDPAPGETFLMQWELRVDEVPAAYPFDPTVALFSDSGTAVAFEFGERSIRSVFETSNIEMLDLSASVRFELRSHDMVQYELFANEHLLMAGRFTPAFTESEVGWGDGIQGSRSLAQWSYFSFGVIPEPHTGVCMVVLTLLLRHYSQRRRS